MEGVGWIGTLVVGGLAGWIASRVMHARTGLVANVLLGVAGAVVLNFALIRLSGSTYGGLAGQLAVAAIGASLLIWLYRFVTGRNPR
ncbi:MAG: GlsB/YeaQ/YmgE family stress response membrane protein [Alphaproteobacteria bacterium]